MNICLIPEQMIEEVMKQNDQGIYTECKGSLLISMLMLMVGTAVFLRALMDIGAV